MVPRKRRSSPPPSSPFLFVSHSDFPSAPTLSLSPSLDVSHSAPRIFSPTLTFNRERQLSYKMLPQNPAFLPSQFGGCDHYVVPEAFSVRQIRDFSASVEPAETFR